MLRKAYAEKYSAWVGIKSRFAAARALRVIAPSAGGQSRMKTALTERELSILRLIASGASNGEIARALHLTEGARLGPRGLQGHHGLDSG